MKNGIYLDGAAVFPSGLSRALVFPNVTTSRGLRRSIVRLLLQLLLVLLLLLLRVSTARRCGLCKSYGNSSAQSYRRTGFSRFSPSATCGIIITVLTYYTRVHWKIRFGANISLPSAKKTWESTRGKRSSALTVLFGHREFEKPSSLPKR